MKNSETTTKLLGKALPICNGIENRIVAVNLTGFCEKLANPLSKKQKYVDSSCVYLIEYSNVKQRRQSKANLVTEDPRYIKARTVVIDAENAGRRLDNYLIASLKNVAKSYVYRIIRRGEVRVNGGRKKAHTKLALDDRIRIPPFRQSTQLAPVISKSWCESIAKSIVYEDDALLVLDKPAGLAVHGGSGKAFGLIDIVKQEMGEHVELAHRLDKDTTGCLLLGKSPSITRELHRQFRAGEVDKRYRTLLRGEMAEQKIDVSAPLSTQRKDLGEAKTRVDNVNGKQARSTIVMINACGSGQTTSTYADVFIETGRTHQIRVHAAHSGHPVAGDPRYGDATFNRSMAEIGLTRPYLHSASLRFRHPVNGREIAVETSESEQMLRILSTLGYSDA